MPSCQTSGSIRILASANSRSAEAASTGVRLKSSVHRRDQRALSHAGNPPDLCPVGKQIQVRRRHFGQLLGSRGENRVGSAAISTEVAYRIALGRECCLDLLRPHVWNGSEGSDAEGSNLKFQHCTAPVRQLEGFFISEAAVSVRRRTARYVQPP